MLTCNDGRRTTVEARSTSRFHRQSGHACCEVKNTQNGRSKDRCGRLGTPGGGVLPGKSSSAVGRPCQRNTSPLCSRFREVFGRVSHCINLRISSLMEAVRQNATCTPEGQAGVRGKPDVGANAKSENDQSPRDLLTVAEFNTTGDAIFDKNSLQPMSEVQLNIVPQQFLVKGSGDFRIEWGQNLRLLFHQCYPEAASGQLFDKLQPDKTSPHHNGCAAPRRRLRHRIHRGRDPVHIGDVSQRKDTRSINAGDRRNKRSSPW